MSLFEEVLNAINEPDKQANSTQISQIIGVIEQFSQVGNVNDQKSQALTSIVGKYVRSALKEKQQSQGMEEAEAVIEKYGGTSPNAEAVNAVMTPQKQQEMAEEAAKSTGLNREVIESMLPSLIPVVLNLLQTGATKVKNPGSVNNSVLQSFLDTDGDEDVDIADALSLAKQFLSN